MPLVVIAALLARLVTSPVPAAILVTVPSGSSPEGIKTHSYVELPVLAQINASPISAALPA